MHSDSIVVGVVVGIFATKFADWAIAFINIYTTNRQLRLQLMLGKAIEEMQNKLKGSFVRKG